MITLLHTPSEIAISCACIFQNDTSMKKIIKKNMIVTISMRTAFT